MVRGGEPQVQGLGWAQVLQGQEGCMSVALKTYFIQPDLSEGVLGEGYGSVDRGVGSQTGH